MGVDDYGLPIRTWTLSAGTYGINTNMYYFRTDIPPYEFPDFVPTFMYAGMSAISASAYNSGGPPGDYGQGMTAEFDQLTNNASPIPDNPECPANKCGVAMQFSGLGISLQLSINSGGSGGRTKYHYLRFNHALFFRRSFTFVSVTKITTTLKPSEENPSPEPVITYDYISSTYIPDDRNFCDDLVLTNYFVSANSIFTIIVPPNINDDEKTVDYFFEGTAMTDIEEGD
jgi:hypothetical protein